MCSVRTLWNYIIKRAFPVPDKPDYAQQTLENISFPADFLQFLYPAHELIECLILFAAE